MSTQIEKLMAPTWVPPGSCRPQMGPMLTPWTLLSGYDNPLLLEGSARSYKQNIFLDIYIHVVDDKCVTGIYHKVDDFNFDVINYPFPQCNVNSILGYTTFYSQLIRFFRLSNNINDFLFRAKLSYSKLVKRGYMHSLLFKYFERFCLAYNINEKHGEKRNDLLFSRMIKYSPSVSHYNDVIMSNMASQITSLPIVYLTVYSGADQRTHQSSASLAFVWGIHRWPVNSQHKGRVTRKMLPFDDVIMLWCKQCHWNKWYCQTMFDEITSITSCFKFICKNKPPLPTNVFDDINTPTSCINTMDINDIERSSSYNLTDIAKCSTIPSHEKKNGHRWLLTVSSRWIHVELTVTKMVTASRDRAVTWAVIDLWPSRDWAVIAVIELWPRRDWAVT